LKRAAPFKTSSRIAAPGAAAALPALALLGIVLLMTTGCLAQGAHHPFAVGANEGAAGGAEGLSGWLLGMESGFLRLLTGAIRAAKQSNASAWSLAGLSLAYGVFHAAGPGHGKAVIASYMLANESVLRRGLAISLAAALLQGLVAIAIVGTAALVLGATAKRMTAAANMVEIVGYAGIVVLGASLVYTKGAALLSAWRAAPFETPEFAPAGFRPSQAGGGRSNRFSAEDCSAARLRGSDCGHFHAPDPRALESGFSWKTAALTVLAAGARPCSGAILVLVFAAAQGIFLAGIGAVAAMSLGSAATTGALAALAVLAKKTATKYAKAGAWRTLIAGRLFEAGAALAVLLFGLALLVAALSGARLTS
jgi:nickel/cobalt exporter